MSGPKVVRIVTRQEMQAIKSSHVTRLEAMVSEIEQYAEKQNMLSDIQIDSLKSRLKKYQSMDVSQYQKIAAEIPSQIEFLKNEKLELEGRVKKNALTQKEKRRHLKSSIKSLRQMYEARSLTIPETILKFDSNSLLRENLDMQGLEKTLQECYIKIQENDNEISDDSRELSQRLNQGQKTISFDVWLSQLPVHYLNASQQRLETMISELESVDIEDEAKGNFISRGEDLLAEKISQTLDMKIDTLCIEINHFIKAEREKNDLQREYLAALKDLSHVEIEYADTIKIETATSDEIRNSIEIMSSLYEKSLAERAANAKRSALFAALNKMGYKVDENMDAAFVKNGRLVVSKSQDSTYGVEVGSAKNLQRVQLRVVADKESQRLRSQANDKKAEEDWCDDFHSIKSELFDLGISLEIDRQFSPGETKLKQVDFEDARRLSSAIRRSSKKQLKDR